MADDELVDEPPADPVADEQADLAEDRMMRTVYGER